MFNKISLEKLREDEGKVVFEKDKSYLVAYPEFLKYFEDVDVLTVHHLVIGIHFTYGWMPTIFNFKNKELEKAVEILNRAKKDEELLTEKDLEDLRECLNNSLVGVSKLLHFIRPDKYAIWDSRVYRYINEKSAYQYQIHEYKAYLNYLQFCESIISQPAFDSLHTSMEEKVGYKMTPLRSLELIMFKNGAAPKGDKPNENDAIVDGSIADNNA